MKFLPSIIFLASTINAAWTVPDRCLQEFPMSMCRAYFVRFAYNQETGECSERVWGGCGDDTENTNFFSELSECNCECLGKC